MAVQTQIQMRRGTASSWTSTNPTLAAGEVGFESDTGKFKIGTGSATWTSLAYSSILPSTVTTKGDLLAASAANTVTRQAVGADAAYLVADSSQSTGLNWASGNNGAAGKNAVINGGFDIWQRGTSIAIGTGNTYTADRFSCYRGVTGATITRQTTSDSTNLPNIQYCARVQRDSGNTNTSIIYFREGIETVNTIPFAGKTVTLSFYARKGADFSAASNTLRMSVGYGTGTDQSPIAYTGEAIAFQSDVTLTTTWQRFTATGTIPTTATEMYANAQYTPVGTASTNDYFEVTGVQLELGSVATPFARTGGTIQGELAACQRYFQVIGGTANGFPMATGYASAASQSPRFPIAFAVTMRTAPVVTKNGTWATGNTGQPAASYIGTNGFAMELSSSGAGQCYAYPDSTDDTFTCNSEL